MKLERTLTVGTKAFDIVDEDVVLEANNAGRATFVIDTLQEEITPFSAVALDIGYTQHEHDSRFFVGYIESVNKKDSRQAVLFCRELAGVLANRLPLSLRHPSMRDVLAAIETKSGLNFTVPSAGYDTVKIPHFSNIGSGYHALTFIGRAFRIKDFFWQQQADGAVYIGSWDDSPWPDRDVELPDDYFTEQLTKSAKIPALPSLRPGVILNNQRVSQVRFQGNFMQVVF